MADVHPDEVEAIIAQLRSDGHEAAAHKIEALMLWHSALVNRICDLEGKPMRPREVMH